MKDITMRKAKAERLKMARLSAALISGGWIEEGKAAAVLMRMYERAVAEVKEEEVARGQQE